MRWHAPIPDDIEAHESRPLLRDNKKNGAARVVSFHNEAPARQTKYLFAVTLLIVVGGLIYVKVQATRKGFHGSDSVGSSTSGSRFIDTTHTLLPGVFPKDASLRDPDIRQLRWGILGLGRIARDFATALKMSGANITAAAAGSLPDSAARAKQFAQRYSIPQAYGSYEEMAADTSVDIVYIATINPLHHETAMMMLQAGKNVLLEKPMTMNYREAQDLATAAKKAKRLLLTNYWSRFFPVIKYVRSVLATNRLGPISAMRGDIGFPTYPVAQDRFLSRSRGGGAMLDVGCYLVNLAIMVNPSVPRDIKASAQTTYMDTEYRVDTETSFLLNWDGTAPAEPGTVAFNVSSTSPMMFSGQASFRRPSSFEFEINAQHGRVVIHAPANAANAATVYEYEPFGAVRHIEEVYSELPRFDSSFGPKQYPRGEGFVYVIHDIEKCMLEKGIPGADDNQRNGCLELEQLSLDDQLLTVRITAMVMRDAGYWDW